MSKKLIYILTNISQSGDYLTNIRLKDFDLVNLYAKVENIMTRQTGTSCTSIRIK